MRQSERRDATINPSWDVGPDGTGMGGAPEFELPVFDGRVARLLVTVLDYDRWSADDAIAEGGVDLKMLIAETGVGAGEGREEEQSQYVPVSIELGKPGSKAEGNAGGAGRITLALRFSRDGSA